MFEEIKDTFEDIKDKVGDNWFYIGLGVLALLFIFLASRGDEEDGNTMKAVTGITSYPDAVTNADEIIGTLQDSLDYSEGVIIDRIETLDKDIENNFTVNNGYIVEGFENMKDMIQQEFDDLQGDISDSRNSTGSGTQVLNESDIKSIMEANSKEWHTASDERKKELEAQNQELGAQLGASFNSGSGKWSDDSGEDLYDYTEVTNVRNNSIEEQMKANSAEWHTASAERKKELEEANKSLGAQLGATFNSGSGEWTDSSGKRVN